MASKRKGKLKYILLVVVLLVLAGVGINWYMAHRLEVFLKEKLNEEVANATDGFYNISFDFASVGFFNGELTIKGLSLEPDSAVFNAWKQRDSLPYTYAKINIESINFKGVNLTWHFNYRSLHFDLFEIQSPRVEVFDSYSSGRYETKTKNIEDKSLYEMVSPFFDVVSVKKMNLVNANISFVVEDSVMPSIYKLEGANFYTYNFFLNKDSEASGKLLYCDNFEFLVDKPQTLLDNPQLLLNAETIKLSTIDSVVLIKGVSLEPREDIWQKKGLKPDNYLKAKLEAVELGGIEFTRENSLNFLHARSFDIVAADLHYFDHKKDRLAVDTPTVTKKEVSNIIQSWSLYQMISPIFARISIGGINIDDAMFQYTSIDDKKQDYYKLDKLEVHAQNFLVDSLADIENRFWHSESFDLEAQGVKGIVQSKNHEIEIKRIGISMLEKYLKIENIRIKPISFNSNSDILSGSVNAIGFDNFIFSEGIEADELYIKRPIVNYTRNSNRKTEVASTPAINVLDLVPPYFRHLLIKNIKMSDANITFRDKLAGQVYQLRHLSVSGKNFLMNDTTFENKYYPFECDNVSFRFRNFDNLLPNKDYRLTIKDASFSSKTGNLSLNKIELIPQKQLEDKADATYMYLNIPSFNSNSTIYNYQTKALDINMLNIDSLCVHIVKKGNVAEPEADKTKKENPLLSYLKYINIKNIELSNINFSNQDITTEDSLSILLDKFKTHNVVWGIDKIIKVGGIAVEKPQVKIRKGLAETKPKPSSVPSHSFGYSVNIGQMSVTDIGLDIVQPDLRLEAQSEQITLSDLKRNISDLSLNIKSFHVVHPVVNIYSSHSRPSQKNVAPDSEKGVYTAVGKFADNVLVRNIDIAEAQINYVSDSDGYAKEHQQLNKTNLKIDDFEINSKSRKTAIGDITFSTKDLSLPVDNGFYTLNIGNVDLSKKQSKLIIDNLHLVAKYPMLEFAAHHPSRKDWFDIAVGNISLSGIDITSYLSDDVLKANYLEVNDVLLQNFKNQKLPGKRRISPMIYEKLQKMPFGLLIDSAETNNFTVEYYELAKNGTTPGRLVFQGMDSRISGLTNIVNRPNQYIHLDATGKVMGTGAFAATWLIPVDSLNDHFRLTAHVSDFNFSDLNQFLSALAPVEVRSGTLKDLTFDTNASSKDASVEMLFLYNDLNIAVYKNLNLDTESKFYTRLANKVIKSNNPNKVGKKPRTSNITITRDPYHSTFNYFWQILAPSLTESVGVSQKKQNFVKKVSGIIGSIKSFFRFKKKDKQEEGSTEN